jgi:hypothetical protein
MLAGSTVPTRRSILTAAATAAAVIGVVNLAPASGQGGVGATPIFVDKIPSGYRDWTLISVAHEEGNLHSFAAILGNKVAIKAFREEKLSFPDGTIIAALHWRHTPSEENNKVFGRAQSFVAGSATNVQFMVKDSKKYASTGGWGFGHFNERDGNKPGDAALLKPACPATRRPKIATSSSPVTHRDTESHWTSPAHDQGRLTTTKVSEIGAASDATVCLPTAQGVASAPYNPLQQVTAAVRLRAVQRRTSGSHC